MKDKLQAAKEMMLIEQSIALAKYAAVIHPEANKWRAYVDVLNRQLSDE